MASDCPHCGEKLRPRWTRCPRCRQVLPGEGRTAGAAAPEGVTRSRSVWIGGTALALAVLLGVVWSTRSTPSVSSPVIQAASPESEEIARLEEAASEPAVPQASPASSFASIEANRAAGAAYSAGDFAAALQQLEAAVAASPDDPAARNNLGQVLVRQGRAADALPHLTEAVRLDGQRWEYRFNRARAYGLLDRWPEAVAEYRIAAQIFPEDHVTSYNLGLALLRVRDYSAAATSLEQAVAARPDQHDFLITLGTAYVGAEQPDRARATFERFLEVAPNDVEAPKVRALLQALAESAP
jgi:tetratricopeptide (TPR) repeat protein